MAERVILITGASGGLAQAIVKKLPSSDQLILLGRDEKKLEKLYGDAEEVHYIGIDEKAEKAEQEEKIEK